MATLQRTIVNTTRAPQPIGAYAQAVRVQASELVYIAGQVAVDVNGNLVGKGDAQAQTCQVFENLGQILASLKRALIGRSRDREVEVSPNVEGLRRPRAAYALGMSECGVFSEHGTVSSD